MRFPKFLPVTFLLFLPVALYPSASSAWFDETHLAIAKVAGYQKWFNAGGPDLAKLKMGDKEDHNPFMNNPKGHRGYTGDDPGPTTVQPERPGGASQQGYSGICEGLY